jgi:hypothetical protein
MSPEETRSVTNALEALAVVLQKTKRGDRGTMPCPICAKIGATFKLHYSNDGPRAMRMKCERKGCVEALS